MRRVIMFMTVVACGLGVALYPSANSWQKNRVVAATAQSYHHSEVNSTLSERDLIFQSANDYNMELAHTISQQYFAEDAAVDTAYQEQLSIAGSPLMGQVIVPSLDIRLGIYHGVSDEVLEKGAGHIYGTSLPVGGPSTHAAISAHTGYAKSEMFGRLPELKIGDEFFIIAGGGTLRYVVDNIEIVEPDDSKGLNIVPGEDYVTLVTCTPPGINSHRLLVRGVRAEIEPQIAAAIGTPTSSNFPWWLAQFAGGLASAGLLAGVLENRRKVKQNASNFDPMNTRAVSRLPKAPAIAGIALLIAAASIFGATNAQAVPLPSPIPTPLPVIGKSGSLTVIKGKSATATEFIVTPILSIGGTPIDLTTDSGWRQIASFDISDMNSAVLGAAIPVITGPGGGANFSLPLGAYYVTETNDTTLIATPQWRAESFIVTIPYPDPMTGQWQYQINAAPKLQPLATPTPTPTQSATPTGTPKPTRRPTVSPTPVASPTPVETPMLVTSPSPVVVLTPLVTPIQPVVPSATPTRPTSQPLHTTHSVPTSTGSPNPTLNITKPQSPAPTDSATGPAVHGQGDLDQSMNGTPAPSNAAHAPRGLLHRSGLWAAGAVAAVMSLTAGAALRRSKARHSKAGGSR